MKPLITARWKFAAAALLIASWTSPSLAAGPAHLATAPSQTGASGAGASFNPGFSADGRFLTFITHANNLVTNDNLGLNLDVFVRDLITSNLTLVSVNLSGTGGGNDNATFSTISSNGQFVAFESAASDLAPNDTNRLSDIFVRDLVAKTTTLISRAPSGQSAFGASTTPTISADGRWVVFESTGYDLTPLGTLIPFQSDIYAYDRWSNAVQMVSVNKYQNHAGSSASTSPAMTPDGRKVAFVSASTDLVEPFPYPTGLKEIWVRDLTSNRTAWASISVSGMLSTITNVYHCSNPAFSADGRFIVFQATPGNLPWSWLFRRDLQTQVTTVISTNTPETSLPQISDDGRFIVHEDGTNIFLWDAQTGSNSLVNLNTNGTTPGNAPARSPSLSSSGNTVVFVSGASDLATNATGVTTNNWQVFARDLVNGVTRMVSMNSNGLASTGNHALIQPAVSADGTRAAFESVAGDLVAQDFNGVSDIFLRELAVETTTLLSARHAARHATSLGHYFSLLPDSVSTNGRYLVFSQLNDPTAARDTNGRPDVMLFDVQASLARAISFDTNVGASNTNLYRSPIISADGSKVVAVRSVPEPSLLTPHLDVFAWSLAGIQTNNSGSTATGPHDVSLPTQGGSMPAVSRDGRLVLYQSGTGNNLKNIYLAAPWSNPNDSFTNRLISATPDGLQSGNGSSIHPLFSPDGRWAVFQSKAGNLLTNGNGSPYSNFQFIAADLGTNYSPTNFLINPPTRLASQDEVPQDATNAVFSANSRYLYYARAPLLGIYRHDLLLNTNVLIAENARNPSPSADGRWVAYEWSNALPQQISQVIVKDLQTGLTNLVSVNRLGTGGGNASSTAPLLSGDARFVVFVSRARDLVDNDTNKLTDVFVRDRLLGVTVLVSGSPQTGTAGNSISSRPVLGADGRTVVFQSFASDLAPGDYNDRRDVFVLHLGGKDSDGDGMDDDWEMACFGNLSRDGTGDFDGDGVSDKLEFLAGTDPTNGGSVLRVLKITRLVGGGTTLIWSAVPGRNYRVEFKAGLADAGWTDLPGPVTLNGSTGSAFDATASGQAQRYYRVSLITP